MVASNVAAAPAEDYSKSYPYSFETDGWHLVHEALKNDMRLFFKALQQLAEQLEGGNNLEQWQTKGIQTFWLQFGTNLHKHHDHEEEFFFPWMATKMQMPQRMTDDHKTIMTRQTEITGLVAELSAEAPVSANLQTITTIQGKFKTHEAELIEHFNEEEELAPEMRRTFHFQEYRATTQKMVKQMSPYEMPSLLCFMPEAERRAFMKQEGIPGFVQSLIILPKTKKYTKLYVDPIQYVVAGTPPPEKKSFLAALFGM